MAKKKRRDGSKFLKAAQLVDGLEDGACRGACWAMSSAGIANGYGAGYRFNGPGMAGMFHAMFSPDGDCNGSYYWLEGDPARVLALLLAKEMWENP